MRTPSHPQADWNSLYRTGAVVAVIAVLALVFDIVLSSIPGWGTATVPVTAEAWLAQAHGNPWLAARNLDLLNVTVSILSLPFYLALVVAMRRSRPALATLGLVVLVIGTALFASANAALPMIELGRAYADAGAAGRPALVAAASSLLARGAHGSMGAFAGFFLSEVGTLIVAAAMMRAEGVFTRRLALLGVLGGASLALYSSLVTFSPVPTESIVALAAPGGLLMIAWQAGTARRLWVLSTSEADGVASV